MHPVSCDPPPVEQSGLAEDEGPRADGGDAPGLSGRTLNERDEARRR